MQKYLSIPVKNEQNQLVLINDVAIVEQESTTSVKIHYTSGKHVEVVHDTMAANNEEVRDAIEDAMLKALQLAWTKPSHQLSLAGITDAAGGVPEISELKFG